jgi:hypothetical protein
VGRRGSARPAVLDSDWGLGSVVVWEFGLAHQCYQILPQE